MRILVSEIERHLNPNPNQTRARVRSNRSHPPPLLRSRSFDSCLSWAATCTDLHHPWAAHNVHNPGRERLSREATVPNNRGSVESTFLRTPGPGKTSSWFSSLIHDFQPLDGDPPTRFGLLLRLVPLRIVAQSILSLPPLVAITTKARRNTIVKRNVLKRNARNTAEPT